MGRNRDGRREPRASAPKRVPKLGYYFIVTDTKETEKNYLYGLRDSLSEELRDHIVIKVSQARTDKLIETCEQASIDPQYRQCWIVFDRDQVKDFDRIIAEAEHKGIKAGWSNPCIEIWFDAYFGKMPNIQDSVHCCQDFCQRFQEKTGQKYKKSDPDLYRKLNQAGDAAEALQRAQRQWERYDKEGERTPSKMCPCTTLHHLVDEIRRKTVT